MFGVLRANGVRPLWIKGKGVTHLLDAVGIVTGAEADEGKAVKLVVIPQNPADFIGVIDQKRRDQFLNSTDRGYHANKAPRTLT